MAVFYIDDSLSEQPHQNHNGDAFCLASILYGNEEMELKLSEVYKSLNLSLDYEYKSSTKKDNNRIEEDLRRRLIGFIAQQNCKLGLVIVAYSEKSSFGISCLNCIKNIITKNNVDNDELVINFDKGIIKNVEIKKYCEKQKLPWKIKNVDSHVRKGIQLADLCVHICATIIKQKIRENCEGCKHKTLVFEDSGFDDPNIDLSFELWNDIRRCFFREIDNSDEGNQLQSKCTSLLVSDGVSPSLKKIVEDTFGVVYMGCVH